MGSSKFSRKMTSAWENVERAYEIWEDMGEIDNVNPTWEDAKFVLQEMDRRVGRKRSLARARFHEPWVNDPYDARVAREDQALIREWLSDRRRWSPVIDDVAVARFERTYSKEAFEALTRRERDLVTDRLPVFDVYTDTLPAGWTYQEWALLRGRASHRRTHAAKKAASVPA